MRRSPASGVSSPAIMRNSVVLPAPFGPITPTIPAGGSENVRSSKSRRSPKPFDTPFASITTSPRRGPGGMWISTLSSFTASSSASSFSYAPSRAFDFAWRAFGARRPRASLSPPAPPSRLRGACFRPQPHPLELALQRPLARRRLLLLDREPRLLLFQPAGVVALVRDAAPAVELEDPAGDVVEEVPVV